MLEFKQSRTLWDPGHIRCTVSRHMCYWMQEVPQLKALLHLGSLRVSATAPHHVCVLTVYASVFLCVQPCSMYIVFVVRSCSVYVACSK